MNLSSRYHPNVIMPLPSSKSISRKLGNVGFSTSWSTVEELKLQHAEELARQNEEHAKRVELLETEIGQCRIEIDALKALSDEHVDTLMPLPSPARSLKFVKNTTRKSRKGAAPMGSNSKQIENIISEMKQQHRKDLAKAAEIYAKKLYTLKKEAEKYKTQAEATRAKDADTSASTGGYDGTGVSLTTGVAQNDKENISRKQTSLHNESIDAPKFMKQQPPAGAIQSTDEMSIPTPRNISTRSTPIHQMIEKNLNDQYERLFLDEHEFEKTKSTELALELVSTSSITSDGVKNEEIDELCNDLMEFMRQVKSKSLT